MTNAAAGMMSGAAAASLDLQDVVGRFLLQMQRVAEGEREGLMLLKKVVVVV